MNFARYLLTVFVVIYLSNYSPLILYQDPRFYFGRICLVSGNRSVNQRTPNPQTRFIFRLPPIGLV
jgi:hypothetical protein